MANMKRIIALFVGVLLALSLLSIVASAAENEAGLDNSARVSIDIGDDVVYITVIAGNGRIINVIKEVKIGVL